MRAPASRRGFISLDAVCLLILLLAVGASCTWNLKLTYHRRNELSAVTVLQLLARAQEHYHAQHATYGLLKDLASLPKELSRGEGAASSFRGYTFQIFLPDAPREAEPGLSAGRVPEPKTHWCAYAWPEHYAWTGRLAFFTHQEGGLYVEEDAALSGHRPQKLAPGLACLQGNPFQEVDPTRWEPLGR